MLLYNVNKNLWQYKFCVESLNGTFCLTVNNAIYWLSLYGYIKNTGGKLTLNKWVCRGISHSLVITIKTKNIN